MSLNNTTTTTSQQGQIMKVELSLHAARLKNVAGSFKGKSDPFAVVTKIATQPGEKPEVLGKTEVYVSCFVLSLFSSCFYFFILIKHFSCIVYLTFTVVIFHFFKNLQHQE